MAKAVFRPIEVSLIDKKVFLDPPTSYPELAHLLPEEEAIEETSDTEEYTGPTADDLRREAEAFQAQWDAQKEALIAAAKAEADAIIKEAEETAFKEVKRQTDEVQALRQKAQDEADQIIADAKAKAGEMEQDSRAAFEGERKKAEETGRIAGREAGYQEGKSEVERLIERTQAVLERAQDKRSEILSDSEQEIIDLVLLISRKVIKIISENQRNVIISNVVQALKKVKDRGNIIIRVNMLDLKLSTEHTKDFIRQIETAKSIQIVEDSTVDQGGCIIETDFGEIDARIASQLNELETKILELSPIKVKTKPDSKLEGV
ncbi:flagellar assembly protein FliH [Breznakiellaceae bacterium SP9]